jgi:hypothetical protein
MGTEDMGRLLPQQGYDWPSTLWALGLVLTVIGGMAGLFYSVWLYDEKMRREHPEQYRNYQFERCLELGGVPIQNGFGKVERCDFPMRTK